MRARRPDVRSRALAFKFFHVLDQRLDAFEPRLGCTDQTRIEVKPGIICEPRLETFLRQDAAIAGDARKADRDLQLCIVAESGRSCRLLLV